MQLEYPEDFSPGVVKTFFGSSSTVWIADGIIYIYSHPNKFHSLEDAMEASDYIEAELGAKKLPMICDVRLARPIPKSVRDYYSSDQGTRNCNKFAFVVASKFSKVLANFFIGFTQRRYPIQMFDSTSKAIAWCKTT